MIRVPEHFFETVGKESWFLVIINIPGSLSGVLRKNSLLTRKHGRQERRAIACPGCVNFMVT